jgi:hypothetical protein
LRITADAKTKDLLNDLDRDLSAVAAEREFDEARLRDTLARATRTLATLSERLAHEATAVSHGSVAS